MSSSVLVGYATRYGSTPEVAEAVAAALRESGLSVDIQLLPEVRTLAGYRAVVMGAPLPVTAPESHHRTASGCFRSRSNPRSL